MDLFSNERTERHLPMEGADVRYHPGVEFGLDADIIERRLIDETPWGQRQTRWGPEPRLTSWHADDGISYRYSGVTMVPEPMSPLLDMLRKRVQDITGACYNSVLLNLYRDGRDSIGFHSDDEPELGARPTIASLSFGAERTFELQHKEGRHAACKLVLQHGSLLVMAGDTQKNWKHGIRKVGASGHRINLTFRMTERR